MRSGNRVLDTMGVGGHGCSLVGRSLELGSIEGVPN